MVGGNLTLGVLTHAQCPPEMDLLRASAKKIEERKKNRDIDMNTFSKFLDRSVLVSA